MSIVDFVRARAAEDAVLARAVDPPDADLLYASRLANQLARSCGGRPDRLTPRQRAVLLRLAERNSRHTDFDPRWRDPDAYP